jgi:hypothetical protein
MSKLIKGTVRFVNHEKHYVEIEYEPIAGGKTKTINGNVDIKTQQKLKEEGVIKKIHTFHIGDTVDFISKLSDRGDKMIAANISYVRNDSLDVLLNKAKTNNEFVGYLKITEDKYFIKEMESYRFFPLEISPWQMKFTDRELTEPLLFSIENIDRKEKATAKLLHNSYIPEYYKALKLYMDKTAFDAEVYLVNEFGIYVNVIGDKIQAKIPLSKDAKAPLPQPGEHIKATISYFNPLKIAVEQVFK